MEDFQIVVSLLGLLAGSAGLFAAIARNLKKSVIKFSIGKAVVEIILGKDHHLKASDLEEIDRLFKKASDE